MVCARESRWESTCGPFPACVRGIDFARIDASPGRSRRKLLHRDMGSDQLTSKTRITAETAREHMRREETTRLSGNSP